MAREPAVEDVHPLRDDERLGGEALVGLGVVAGEGAHPHGTARLLDLAEGRTEILDEDVGGLGVGDEDQHRAIAVVLDEMGDGDGS